VTARRPASSPLEPVRLPPLPREPLASVLIANFNYGRFVSKALESVLGQSYQRFEIVVCDDGSEDDSTEVIEGFTRRDSRIRLLTKPNGGAASALNLAFEASRGEILFLLDADDEFAPEKLEKVVHAMGDQGCGLLVHPLLVVDDKGGLVQRKPAFGRFESGWIAPQVVARGGRWNYMEASAVSFRREVGRLIFPIPEELFRSWADAYVCCVGALVSRVGSIDEALASYRLHGGNVSGFDTFDEDHGRRAMNGYRRLAEGINRKLAELGSRERVSVDDNLSYLESRLQHELLASEGSMAGALRAFVSYARAVAVDDIYGRARKVLSLVFLGSALALPRRLRARWITMGLTHSRAKERLRKLLAAGTSTRYERTGTGDSEDGTASLGSVEPFDRARLSG
jgi:glycosyltransferase involved in cell wall biosynthesis